MQQLQASSKQQQPTRQASSKQAASKQQASSKQAKQAAVAKILTQNEKAKKTKKLKLGG